MSADSLEFPRDWPRNAVSVAGWIYQTVKARDGRPIDYGAQQIAKATKRSRASVNAALAFLDRSGWLRKGDTVERTGIDPETGKPWRTRAVERWIEAPVQHCPNDGLDTAVSTVQTGAVLDTAIAAAVDTAIDSAQSRVDACARSESQCLRVSDGPIGRTDSDDPEPETTTLPSNLQGTTQTHQRAGSRATPAIGRFDKTPPQRPHVPGADPDIHPKAEAVDRCIRYYHPKLIPSAGPDAYQILRELDVLYQRAPEAIEAFRFWRPFDGATKPIAVLLSDIRKCRPGEILTDRAERWRLFLTAPLAWCNEWVAKIQPQAAVAVLDLDWTEDDVRDAIADHRARRRLEAPEDPPTQSDGRDVLSPEEEAAEAAALARWHASSEALRIRLGIPAPPPKPAGPPKEILRPRGWHP